MRGWIEGAGLGSLIVLCVFGWKIAVFSFVGTVLICLVLEKIK